MILADQLKYANSYITKAINLLDENPTEDALCDVLQHCKLWMNITRNGAQNKMKHMETRKEPHIKTVSVWSFILKQNFGTKLVWP